MRRGKDAEDILFYFSQRRGDAEEITNSKEQITNKEENKNKKEQTANKDI